MRGEETNQMFKRDGSPSRLCVFSGKGRRGYSRAGECSNNISPNTQPSLFPFCEEIYFFLFHMLWMDKLGEGCVIKVSLFFSVAPLRLYQIRVIRSDLLAVFHISTWREGRIREGVQTSGLPESNRERDHPYVKSFAG